MLDEKADNFKVQYLYGKHGRRCGGHLRCLIWRQWKRTWTRAKKLMARGLVEKCAWQSAKNGRGSWWNAGSPHLRSAFPNAYFNRLSLVSLLTEQRRSQCCSRTAVVRNRMPGGVGGRRG